MRAVRVILASYATSGLTLEQQCGYGGLEGQMLGTGAYSCRNIVYDVMLGVITCLPNGNGTVGLQGLAVSKTIVLETGFQAILIRP